MRSVSGCSVGWRKCSVGWVVGMCFALSCATSWALDVDPPDWRGEPGSTWQAWDFYDPDPILPPTYVDNVYGIPFLEVVGGMLVYDLPDIPPPHFGAWVDFIKVRIDIPNSPITDPGSWKAIRIQTTFYDPSHLGPPGVVIVPFAGEVGLDIFEVGNDWYVSVADYIIEPNPNQETIDFPHPFPGYDYGVCEVVVDTICVVPEPTTFTLLGLGSLALVMARRRR